MLSHLLPGYDNNKSLGDAMNDKAVGGVHWSFWLIGVIALIWHAMGAMNFVMQLNPAAVAEYPESHRAIIEGRPDGPPLLLR